MANYGGHMYFTRFVLFFNDCDSSSGITNLKPIIIIIITNYSLIVIPTYGTIPIRLKMNNFCFKKIDGLLAKFLGHSGRVAPNPVKFKSNETIVFLKLEPKF